jgi:hypothetical protein
VVALIACNRPQMISNKELAEIFHDAMLVNAYIQHNRQVELDSMNIYEPILAKYGYTKEDMHYTLNKISRQKSASLGNVADYMINTLTAESDVLAEKVAKLDTIDNVARRRYEQVLLRDTAIVATTEADSTKLQITIPHAQKGIYRINISYTIDKEDKGIGRRYYIDWMCGDSMVRNITNGTLIRGRKGRITAEAWLATADSLADNIHIDLTRFNLKKNRLKKHPMTIHEIEVIYSLNLEDAQERLLREQSLMRIFSDTMLYLNIDKCAKTE